MNKKRLAAGAIAALVTIAALATLLVGSSTAAPHKAHKKFLAALISDIGRFNDKSFNQSQLEGLKRAQSKLGINILPLESDSTSQYTPNFVKAEQRGANIIIAAGFLLADDLQKIATQFPNSRFAITDYDVTGSPFNGKKTPNVEGLTYATQENSYLIGCMAAMVVKMQHKPHVIGVVGGIKIPPVDYFLAGYKAGALKCVPGTKVVTGYSGDFNKSDLCKNVADNEIQAKAQVIFAVAGNCGLGALNAAKQAHLWGVGVDRDQSFLGSYILTSAVKRVDIGVFDAIKAAKSRTFKGGGNLVFNLKNNGVALGKISPKLPRAIKTPVMRKLAILRRQIISGKIKPPTKISGT